MYYAMYLVELSWIPGTKHVMSDVSAPYTVYQIPLPTIEGVSAGAWFMIS